MAGFLCTSFTAPAPTIDSGLRPPVDPERPLSLGPAFRGGAKPVYYLPAKLLPDQRKKIDDQIEAAKDAVEVDSAAWDEERRERTRELVQLREKRDEMNEAGKEERPGRKRGRDDGDAPMRSRSGSRQSDSRSRSRSRTRSRSRSRMSVDASRSPEVARAN